MVCYESGTEYTGLINSTADLAYWAGVPDWPHRCRRCGRGQNEYGICLDCSTLIRDETRCYGCFRKINLANYEGGGECEQCRRKPSTGTGAANPSGYKEGGPLSGGLRTNYYRDNTNDNNIKILEG